MAYHSGEKLMAMAGMALIGGVLIGALIGRENRAWLGKNAGEFAGWLEQRSRDTRRKTGKTYENLKHQAEKNFPKNWQNVVVTARKSLQR